MAIIPVTGSGNRGAREEETPRRGAIIPEGDPRSGVIDGIGTPLQPANSILQPGGGYIPKVDREEMRGLARQGLQQLLTPIPQNPKARAAQQQELKAKAAQQQLAQRSRAGSAGMMTSGVGATSEAAVARAGAQQQAEGMRQFDLRNRMERDKRIIDAVSAIPQVQRTQFEDEIFKRAMDEFRQLKMAQEGE